MNKSLLQQRGSGLLEPLIAIAILSFGVLGLARYQINMVSQSTDAQARLAATALSEDLLTQLRVDLVNANCYTVPQAGSCGSTFAKAQAAAWALTASSSLPGFKTATASIDAANTATFKVSLSWASKAFKSTNGQGETRTFEVTTDVRP